MERYLNKPPQSSNQSALAQGVARALGNNAGTSSPPLSGQGISAHDTALQRRLSRVERYHTQSVIRLLIGQRGHAEGLEHPFNYHKTAKCRHVRFGKDVQVLKSKQYGTAHYGGLVVCGNARTCPVCGPIIQEQRAKEIRQFFRWAYGMAKKVFMLTLTFPHCKGMPLAELLEKQREALRILRSGRAHQKLKHAYGMTDGLIRSLEITYGDNGWHPHTHELYPADKDADVSEIKADLLRRWEAACRKAGLLPDSNDGTAFRKHAVDIIDNAKESDYLAKQGSEADKYYWGADREIAKAATKKGKSKGKSPFQLVHGTKAEQALFMDYLEAMRGQRSIFWSNGLKAKVGVDDISDEEAANLQEDHADILALLGPLEWGLIIKHEAKAEILTIAETEGLQGVKTWLENASRSLSGEREQIDSLTNESAFVPSEAYLKRRRAGFEPSGPQRVTISPAAPTSESEHHVDQALIDEADLWLQSLGSADRSQPTESRP